MSETSTIVLDNGTGFCKAGFAGSDGPAIIGRTAVGCSLPGSPDEPTKHYIGSQLECYRPHVSLKYPVSRGIITDWDAMQMIWEEIIRKELNTDPSCHSFLITEPPMNPKSNREGIAEVMYEAFNAPAVHIAMPSVLTLYSLARTSGLVLDSGEGVTTVVPIQDGYALPHAIKRQNIAGRDLTNYLRELLQQRDIIFSANDRDEIIREIKESICYVKPWSSETSGCSELMASYVLPDGSEIKLGLERFRCPEALFDPSVMGVEADGVHELVHSSIVKCDTDLRRNLYGNIILTGGSTMLPGFSSRMKGDLSHMAPANVKIDIVDTQDRLASAWIGGSILASLSLFGRMCVTKREYEESGPSVMHTFL